MATLNTAEVATRLDTDPRTLRKFLRSDEGMGMKVGKGHRWSIEAKEVRSLKSKFAKWDDARRTPAPSKGEDEVTEGDEVMVTEGDDEVTLGEDAIDEIILDD